MTAATTTPGLRAERGWAVAHPPSASDAASEAERVPGFQCPDFRYQRFTNTFYLFRLSLFAPTPQDVAHPPSASDAYLRVPTDKLFPKAPKG